MKGRIAAAVTLAALVSVAGAAPALAETKGRIVGIQPGNGKLQVTFSVAGLAPGQQVDPASFTLSLAGRQLPATAELATAVTRATVVRSVMLLIDTSGSMAGAGIAGARAAAAAYLAKVPADVQVGLITISDKAGLVFRPTTDRGPIRAAVAGLQAGGNTALYDALVLGLRSLPDGGDRQLLLLSDGADDGSRTTLAQISRLLEKGDVALNAVAFRSAGVQSTLGQLTKAAGGRVVATNEAAGLSKAFSEAASNTGGEIVLTAAIPGDLAVREGTVVVTGVAAGQQVSDSALAVGLGTASPSARPATIAGPAPAKLAPSYLRTPWTLYLALVALFLSITFVVGTAAAAFNGRGRMSGRLAIYTLGGRTARPAEPVPADGRNAFTRSAFGLAERAVKTSDLETRLGHRLDAGGIPLKPAEWLLLHVGITLLAPLFVLFLTNANLPLTAMVAVLAVLGPWFYLKIKKRLRTSRFLAQLPDVLQLMSGSLSAGYSLPQAVDAVVRQGNEPVAAEFNKALVEARIGAPIEDALEDVGTRMDSVDFGWVVMAIRIQRDVGGNLAEILSTVAATLRERERLRRQVRVLSAEGRLSAYILGGLPVMFGIYLLLTKPSYLRPLVTDPIGWILLGGMAILMVVGSFWMKKVVTVEV